MSCRANSSVDVANNPLVERVRACRDRAGEGGITLTLKRLVMVVGRFHLDSVMRLSSITSGDPPDVT